MLTYRRRFNITVINGNATDIGKTDLAISHKSRGAVALEKERRKRARAKYSCELDQYHFSQ